MSLSRRLSTALALAASACALGAPAAHADAPADGRGVVLSFGGHTVRLVDRAHRVGNMRVSSTRGLRRGDVVRVQQGRARVTGHARRVSFLGRVVRSSSRGTVVRLGDGSTFKFGGVRALRETLLITIATGRRGDAVVAVKRRSSATKVGGEGDRGAPRDDESCDDDEPSAEEDECAEDPGDDDWVDEADGTVTAIADDQSSLTVALDDGSGEETYPVDDPSLLDDVAVGDEVAVSLDEDGTAVDVELLDWSDEDPGAGDDEDE